MACPDGCGDIITVNLDDAAGPAWRLYKTKRGLTLYPSVWREAGCQSHFIVWNNTILWLDEYDEPVSFGLPPRLEDQVLRALGIYQFVSYVALADELKEIPWTVLWACENLVARGMVERGIGKKKDFFRRAGVSVANGQPAPIKSLWRRLIDRLKSSS